MVYIQLWEDFQAAAEDLYAKQPAKTRYSVKWKSSEGILDLKITDDTTCLKFKTHSSIILNRFEALNLSLMRKMQNRKAPTPIAIPQSAPSASAAATPLPATVSQAAATGANSSAAAGVKKKKKGGKKK